MSIEYIIWVDKQFFIVRLKKVIIMRVLISGESKAAKLSFQNKGLGV